MTNILWHTYKRVSVFNLWRCNCGSEFKTEDDALEHAMTANEEQAKELRKLPK